MASKTKTFLKRMVWIILGLVIVIVIGTLIFINTPKFGKSPSGERLAHIEQSPNYREGTFQNQIPTMQITSETPKLFMFYKMLFSKVRDLRPDQPLPVVKTDLKSIPRDEEVIVWMGHSALFMQLNGLKILVDPVLVSASPIDYFNKKFDATYDYKPEDLPEVDYLIITHDHWDHLDYDCVTAIKDRVGRVITALGVGEHLAYWGYNPKKIIEMDWYESQELKNGLKFTAFPARHFSGRGFTRNKSLWMSMMLESTAGNIYLSGDSGPGPHFEEIKQKFPEIDLAILENGQYNNNWKYIHFIPQDLEGVIQTLQPTRVFTVHNSKFALARHAWFEPLELISKAADKNGFNLLTPKMGEPIHLKDSNQIFEKWWQGLEKD